MVANQEFYQPCVLLQNPQEWVTLKVKQAMTRSEKQKQRKRGMAKIYYSG